MKKFYNIKEYMCIHMYTHTYVYMKYEDEKDSWVLAP